MGTVKPFVYALVAIFLSALAADAQSEAAIGRLTCNLIELSESVNFPEASLECEFRTASGGEEKYAATISGIGEGLQVEELVVLV